MNLLNLNKEQQELIQWLTRHKQQTALETWNLLFRERESENPDRCIAYYDALTPPEKAEVELVIARFFTLLYAQGTALSYRHVMNFLAYDEQHIQQ